MDSNLDDQLDASETAVLEAAYAVDRLSQPLPPDPTDARLGPPCPQCGRPLVVDVALHPTDTGTLIGVARGVKPHECQS